MAEKKNTPAPKGPENTDKAAEGNTGAGTPASPEPPASGATNPNPDPPAEANAGTEGANPPGDPQIQTATPDTGTSEAVVVAEPATPAQVATPPAPPAKKDPLQLFNPVRNRVVEMMNEEWFQREASFALQSMANNATLANTTIQSRIQCLLNLANTGLTLNPVQRLAYLVPRKGKCILEPSYMGLIKAVTDSGSVKLIRAEIVYQGDELEYETGIAIKLRHVPYWRLGNERGEVMAAYSVAILHDGTPDVLAMGRDVLDQIKGSNESVKAGNFSPYKDWENEMFRKAPIRRHVKTLPRTERMERLMHAIALDEAQYGSDTAANHGAATEEGQKRDLRLRIAEGLDNYEGENKEEIRERVAELVRTSRFTVDLGRTILAEITGQANG